MATRPSRSTRRGPTHTHRAMERIPASRRPTSGVDGRTRPVAAVDGEGNSITFSGAQREGPKCCMMTANGIVTSKYYMHRQTNKFSGYVRGNRRPSVSLPKILVTCSVTTDRVLEWQDVIRLHHGAAGCILVPVGDRYNIEVCLAKVVVTAVVPWDRECTDGPTHGCGGLWENSSSRIPLGVLRSKVGASLILAWRREGDAASHFARWPIYPALFPAQVERSTLVVL